MKELIKITEYKGQQVVSARELHRFLESKQDFSNWIRNRISKYGFTENQDFEVFNKIIENPNGGRPLTEYALTIYTAKELAMVEGNNKGKQARQYFLECERKLKQQTLTLPQNYKEALLELIKKEEEKEQLLIQNQLQQQELQKQAPKVAYYEEVLQSESTYNTNQIAKQLGMSAITLNKKLKDYRVQYKQGGSWLLYHKYQNKGYTKTKTHIYTDTYGHTQTSMQTVWTEEGRLFIHNLLKNTLTPI